MLRSICGAAGLALAILGPGPASAQDMVAIGMINEYSGQFADTGNQIDHGVTLYMKQHGDTVAGKKIELIRKDTGGIAPDLAKRLSQEAIVRDHADILGGFSLTPNALAAADVSAQAKKFMVVMNAAASIIPAKSPYITRTSYTLSQSCGLLGRWASANGVRRVFSLVADYAPGLEGEAAFQKAFKKAGAEIAGTARMPLANPEFAAFVQRAKDANPDGIFVFVPGGSQPVALAKVLIERGIDPAKIKVMGDGTLTDPAPLRAMGDAAIGIITAYQYDYSHKSAENAAFVKAYDAEFSRNPDTLSVGGYDGMHLIYQALKMTGGQTDAESLITAAKGLAWESPRGPIAIDAQTRDIINTIYIRRVERVGNRVENVEIERYENVRDPLKGG
jgi:branched-chain amino acid transport system substrate-binding protein